MYRCHEQSTDQQKDRIDVMLNDLSIIGIIKQKATVASELKSKKKIITYNYNRNLKMIMAIMIQNTYMKLTVPFELSYNCNMVGKKHCESNQFK